MCGRAAQSLGAVETAASNLGATVPPRSEQEQDESNPSTSRYRSPFHRNVQNMSPGYTFYVFQKAQPRDNNQHEKKEPAAVTCSSKVWGLVTRPGTQNHPLPPGPSKHFSNMMFNARSEEAADKISFGKLIRGGQSCVVVLDGFYEWKVPSNNTLSKEGSGKKQPYLLHRSDNQPLYVAGLYTSVAIGPPEDGVLSTFTLFTTAVSSQLSWLHTRMPLLLFDMDDVNEWIQNPSPALLQKLSTKVSASTYPQLTWHPVTKRMSSSSYQGYDCMEPVELETIPSVKSFFVKKEKGDTAARSGDKAEKSFVNEKPVASKRPLTMKDFAATCGKNDGEGSAPSSVGNKRIKIDSSSKQQETKGKATIKSFFSPKKNK